MNKAQHKSMEELTTSERRYRELVEHIFEIVFQCSADGEILFLNKSWVETFGYTLDNSLHQNICDYALEDDRYLITELFEVNTGDNVDLSREVRFLTKKGLPLWMLFSISKSSDGNYIGSLHNIHASKMVAEAQKKLNASLEQSIQKRATELEKLNAQIEYLSLQDGLTKLPNRRLFFDKLRQTIDNCQHNKHNNALLFIDIDNFKSVNDNYGHDYGDLLLKEVANRIETNIQTTDTLARFAGDEFVVVIPELGDCHTEAKSRINDIANGLSMALVQPFQLHEIQYQTSVSIGIVLFSDGKESASELLKQADIAMYKAKQTGKNSICFFEPHMQAEITRQLKLEQDLTRAIAENEFVLFYQPQLDQYSHVIGAEALIRWLHPVKYVVGPNEFIPLAEKTGLIVPIGEWILKVACEQLAAWQERIDTQHLTLSVNVSARQFHDKNFVPLVLKLLKKYNIPNGKLRLEITETMLINDIGQTIVLMNTLKNEGVLFALDDFGTGYSSLSYLQKLPLNQLKIDRSFVSNLENDMSGQSIVRTIISMTQALDLYTVAEGVETLEQRVFLESEGCMSYQGFLYSMPLPIQEFELFLEESNNAFTVNNFIL